MIKPNNCPFCGSSEIEVQTDGYLHEIECDGCGVTGPVYDSHDKAVEAWNRRATQPATKKTLDEMRNTKEWLYGYRAALNAASLEFRRANGTPGKVSTRLLEMRRATFTQPAVGEPVACEYCGPGKHTGLPGGACESCMNTGLKYPNEEASKPVYQVENCGVWEDVSEEQQARCKDFAYRVRTLWTAPPAAAHGDGAVHWDGEGVPPVGTICEVLWNEARMEYLKTKVFGVNEHGQPIHRFEEGPKKYEYQADVLVTFTGTKVFRPIDATMRAQGDGEVQ